MVSVDVVKLHGEVAPVQGRVEVKIDRVEIGEGDQPQVRDVPLGRRNVKLLELMEFGLNVVLEFGLVN